MGGLCIATSLHHVNGVVVITAIASVFIILFIHYLVIFDFAILFHKVSKPVTEGYPDFYESEIYYVLRFTLKSISEDQTPIYQLLSRCEKH